MFGLVIYIGVAIILIYHIGFLKFAGNSIKNIRLNFKSLYYLYFEVRKPSLINFYISSAVLINLGELYSY